MTKKNLIYTGCFFNEKYVHMLDLLFESIIKYGKINFKKTRILVMTDNALISEYNTVGNETTLIIVSPEDKDLFSVDASLIIKTDTK